MVSPGGVAPFVPSDTFGQQAVGSRGAGPPLRPERILVQPGDQVQPGTVLLPDPNAATPPLMQTKEVMAIEPSVRADVRHAVTGWPPDELDGERQEF